MNSVDRQYCDLLSEIIEKGDVMDTRAGAVHSLFDRTMRFNLSEGLPLLTTKKVFTKGIIHELLWFLKGDTNIKYLVENGVNIWTDDAYRWFMQDFLKPVIKASVIFQVRDNKDEVWKNISTDSRVIDGEWAHMHADDFVSEMTKERFSEMVLGGYTIPACNYRFGDLGPIYGKQWRSFGTTGFDQIADIVDKLKNNPTDRRIILTGWNPDVFGEIALPACHMIANFYTSKLTPEEQQKIGGENPPKYRLSCSFFMRSNDFCCGNPYNIAQYAMLTYMLCEVCNMVPGELVWHGVNVHVYDNHITAAREQLSRKGSDIIPKLRFARKITSIDDFRYDDFILEDYYPDKPIKYELNVG